MRLLLLNTCGTEGTIALADATLGQPVVATQYLPGRGSSEELLPAMRRVFDEAGWKVGDLGAVAVVQGPGSFTGVRVGLSAAKGLCEAVGIPMIAISRLGLVAAEAQTSGEVVALLDGGRGEFYVGLYRGYECRSEQLLRHAEVIDLLADGARMAITCEPQVAERMTGVAVRQVDEPGPEQILWQAERRIAARAWTDVAAVDANYLRRTDAELLVERRNAVSVVS